MRPKLIHLRPIQKCKCKAQERAWLAREVWISDPHSTCHMTADLELHWWMTFSSCCYIFWLYKLQQKPPKHPKWSQPARSLHEPAGKLMYWTRGVQRSLGCWMCGEIAFFLVEKLWLQSCFWDAHSWVARAIALLLPHQGTARPRTTRRLWLQRPEIGVLIASIDPKTKAQKLRPKLRRVQEYWRVQKLPKFIEIRKMLGSMNARHICTSLSGAPEWLVGCCRRSLPPKVLGSGSLAPSHGTTHTGFEDGLRKDWEMLTKSY